MENKIVDVAKRTLLKDVEIDFRLLGGMSNYTYVVKGLENDDSKYTVRIPGAFDTYFVSREHEKIGIEIFSDLGLTNETIYFDLNTGEKIAKYVPGKSLNEFSLLTKEDYQSVANLMKKYHNSNITTSITYSPFERLDKYNSYLDKNIIDNKYYEFLNEFLKHKDYLESIPLCLCHNDSQPSNFIKTDNNLLVVDFEFIGMNDLMYDIACFGNVDFKDALNLLKCYYEDVTNDHYKRLYLWRTFQCLQWYNVALFKHLNGLSEELKIPFDAVASKYLNLAMSIYELGKIYY